MYVKPVNFRILEELQMQFPQCASTCKYEQTQTETAIKTERRGEMKSDGGGKKASGEGGWISITQWLSVCAIPDWRQ